MPLTNRVGVKTRKPPKSQAGYTLLELLIVIIIACILITLIVINLASR